MIDCPSCQQPVEVTEKHYGTLFTCSHCNAVYFIGWDGQPEMAEPEEDSFESQDIAETPSAEDPLYSGGYQAEYSPSTEEEVLPDFSTPLAEPTPPSTSDFQPENHSGLEVGAEPELQVEPEAWSVEPEREPELPLAEPSFEVPQEPVTPDTADFADVTDFANGDTEAGPLAYMVVIEGIESSLLLNQLKEAMTDSRFGWDVNGLVEQARGGRLVLRSLSPTKASVLINRIKYMPLKISWRQDVFSGS